ncbi:50S ribosomal protein L31 [Candidatus Dojkabacteria bacterium]|nr:50S ribosomal protein L31 [Candidatus Dojkabacteria bacterium]
MKKGIHPKYNNQVKVTCSCGNTFITGSTLDEIRADLCSKCHPRYTGEQRIVDTENMVSKFEEREKLAAQKLDIRSKRQKQEERRTKREHRHTQRSTSSKTLKDLLKEMHA